MFFWIPRGDESLHQRAFTSWGARERTRSGLYDRCGVCCCMALFDERRIFAASHRAPRLLPVARGRNRHVKRGGSGANLRVNLCGDRWVCLEELL